MPKQRTTKSDPISTEGAEYFLKDIEVLEVSLVGNPAVPKAVFQLRKNANPNLAEFSRYFAIAKVDAVRKEVSGYCLVPNEADLHKDVVLESDLEYAAHSLIKQMAFGTAKGTGTGLEHQVFAGIGYPLESCIDKDGALGNAYGFTPVANGWFLKVKVTDEDVWAKIMNGEITGFSIGGVAKRVPIENTIANSGAAPFAGTKVAIGLTPEQIAKEDDPRTVDEILVDWTFNEELWKLMDALWFSISEIYDSEEIEDSEKKGRIKETVKQFYENVNSLFETVSSGNAIGLARAARSLEVALKMLNLDGLDKSKSGHPTGGQEVDEKKVTEMIDASLAAFKTEIVTEFGKTLDTKFAALKATDPPKPTEKSEGDEEKTPENEIMETLKTIKTTIDGLSKEVDTLKRTPLARAGAPVGDTSGAPTVRRGASEIVRKKNGAIDWAGIDKGASHQFACEIEVAAEPGDNGEGEKKVPEGDDKK